MMGAVRASSTSREVTDPVSDANKNDLVYFESSSMRQLFDEQAGHGEVMGADRDSEDLALGRPNLHATSGSEDYARFAQRAPAVGRYTFVEYRRFAHEKVPQPHDVPRKFRPEVGHCEQRGRDVGLECVVT